MNSDQNTNNFIGYQSVKSSDTGSAKRFANKFKPGSFQRKTKQQ